VQWGGCVCTTAPPSPAYPGKEEYFYITDLISPIKLAIAQ